MAFTNVTLTGTFVDGTGAAMKGWLRFTPTETMHNGTDIRAASPVVAFLSSGAISVVLAATDDSGTTTISGATPYYRVEELIHGQRARSCRIALGHADTTQDLADITPEA